MIDIHSHILPEVDDGSRSWEMSLQMCRMAWEDGITHMVATPHANDSYFYDRPYLEQLIEQLSRQLKDQPRLSLGCDFHLSFENIQDALENPGRYTIDRTPYLLVEFSDFSIPPKLDESLANLINLGLRPIITHPERNPILQKNPERVLDWIAAGCSVQVTANSLTGRWGQKAEQATRWLFEHNAIHVLATDAHSLERRPPILSKARDIAAGIVGAEAARALVEDNPRAIVSGDPLPR